MTEIHRVVEDGMDKKVLNINSGDPSCDFEIQAEVRALVVVMIGRKLSGAKGCRKADSQRKE